MYGLAPLSQGDAGRGVKKAHAKFRRRTGLAGWHIQYTEGASVYQEGIGAPPKNGADRQEKPRANSVLNRERLLEAATEIFVTESPLLDTTCDRRHVNHLSKASRLRPH